jgi:hypothetical protein
MYRITLIVVAVAAGAMGAGGWMTGKGPFGGERLG